MTRRRSPTPSRSTCRRSPTDKTYANQLKGAAILEPIFTAPAAASRRRALSDPSLRLPGAGGERASTPPSATPRSRRPRRMRSTCRRTSSRASATGRNRSPQRQPRRSAAKADKSSQRPAARPWTTWSMPTCSSRRTRRPAPSSTRCNAIDGLQPECLRRPAMRLPPRPARYMVERGDWKRRGGARRSGRAQFAHVHGDDAFRARARGGALRQSGRRQGRHRQARRAARQAARGQRRLLGGAGRHPAAGRDRLPARCRRQARRRAQGHERRRRCRKRLRVGAERPVNSPAGRGRAASSGRPACPWG